MSKLKNKYASTLSLFCIIFFGLIFVFNSYAEIKSSAGKKDSTDILAGLKFRNIGPAIAGGRVSSVVGIPGKPNIYYIGAAGGGVFKTTDGGNSWKAVFEKEPVSSIGAVTVAHSNPSLVWVGTGEANIRNDIADGKGIYFSPDAGATWQCMGLKDAGQIGKVIIDPDNPDIVFAASMGHAWAPNKERGLFKTTDGGKNWKKVLYINDSTGVRDVIFDPGNPKVMFAASWQVIRHPWALIDGGEGSGIYRSNDEGETWTKLKSGLPGGIIGRIALAAAPTNPDHIYALIEAKHGVLWETKDLGEHWHQVSNNKTMDVRPFYFSNMEVAPDNENKIYFLSFLMSVTTDGGKSIKTIAHGVHVDHHAIWIDPENPDRIIEGNDGGVYISHDAGDTWHYCNNIPIEQFYQVATDTNIAYNMGGGLQDNNAWYGPSNNLHGGKIDGYNWFVTAGGDGEYAVPAPSNPDIIYSESQDGYLNRLDLKTGLKLHIRPYFYDAPDMAPADLKYRFNWTTPIAVADNNENEVFLGANVLFKTYDGGRHWKVISPDLTTNDKSKQIKSGGPINLDMSGAETFCTILSIGLAPTDTNVIWIGTDDGKVQVTKDAGKSWSDVTSNIPGLPKWGRVYQVEVSPFNPGVCYIAVDFHMMDNRKPYVYRTDNFGKSWVSISKGLPDDEPAHVVREDPNTKGFLVLGTETGLYYSQNNGADWERIKSNFPTAPVWDLKFVRQTHDIVAATHGRGLFVLDNITPLEEMTGEVAKSKFTLFTIRPVYMFYRWRKGGFGEPGKYSAPNPPSGAVINYYLSETIKKSKEEKKNHESPVKIEITDNSGSVIDTLYGPSTKGIHRVIWNLHHGSPLVLAIDTASGRHHSPHSGPEVVPGAYKIKVTAAGKTETQPVRLIPDPRYSFDMNAAKDSYKASMMVQNDVSTFNELVNRIHNLKSQIGELKTNVKAVNGSIPDEYRDLMKEGEKIDSSLTSIEDTLIQAKRQRSAGEDDIHYLARLENWYGTMRYSIAEDYNRAPDPMLLDELKSLHQKLESNVSKFNNVLSGAINEFNKKASGKNLPTLYAGGTLIMK